MGNASMLFLSKDNAKLQGYGNSYPNVLILPLPFAERTFSFYGFYANFMPCVATA